MLLKAEIVKLHRFRAVIVITALFLLTFTYQKIIFATILSSLI